MPEELTAERDASIRSARQWFVRNRPISVEDASFRVMGLVWAEAPGAEIAAAKHDLVAMQKSNGGWSQLPNDEPDAYSTGEALFAMHESGVPATDAAWAKGLKFLISTQAQDGTWRVHTRMVSPAEIRPKNFTKGFPYGKDEFISYAGSCWATMALLSALPESAKKADTTQTPVFDDASWMRAALFGNAKQLAALLDAGLDPGSRTKSGTTVLMAAA